MHARRLPAALLACLVGCGGAGPATGDGRASALAARSDAPADPCATARDQRGRVAGLLAEGRLDRAARVLERAATTCPADAAQAWIALLPTLAELGRWDDVRSLAALVEQRSDAPAEAKEAAAAAVARASVEDVHLGEDDAAKAPMRAAYADASAKLQAGDLEGAYAGFLRARELWHPNGQALAQAGLAALKLGRRPEAQRLFDRSLVDLERATGKPLTLDLANGFHAPVRDVAWSAKGRIAIAAGASVSILAQSTRREVLRVDTAGAITAIAFSPDGATLATGSEQGDVRLWDAASGAPRGALATPAGGGASSEIASVAFSPSGEEISAVARGEIWSWGVTSLALRRHVGGAAGDPAAANVVAYSSDGKYLAAGSDVGAVGVWDAATGARLRTIALRGEDAADRRVHSVGFARIEQVPVVLVASERHVSAYAALSGDPLAEGVGATAAVASHDGKTVATSDALGLFTLMDAKGALGRALESGVDFRALSVKPRRARAVSRRTIERAAFSPDDAHVITSSVEGGVRIWKVATGESIATLDGYAFAVTALAAGSDWVVSGAKDGRVQAWDLTRGVAGPSFAGFRDEVFGVALSRDALRIWDAGTRAVIQHVGRASHAPGTVSFSPDGAVVTTLWERYDAAEGVPLADNGACASPRQSGLPAAIQFAATGDLACTAESTIYWFGPERGAARFALVGHVADVADLAFSSDGRGLVSGSGDGKVLLWDLPAARLRPDTLVPTRTLDAHAGPVVAVAYSPDGQLVASGSEDGTARLWRRGDGAPIAVVSDHLAPVRAVAFTASGAFLASGGDDGSLLLSRVSDGSPAARLVTVSGFDAAMAVAPDGHIEFFGAEADKARERVLCRVGSVSFELAVCRERFEAEGLLAKIVAGDATYADP